jgi:hypothetical protein
MESKQSKDGIKIEFSKDEAIVLFDWISRINEGEATNLRLDQAEMRILWDLEASFEKVINEIFAEDYNKIVAQAKQRVQD